MEREAGRRKKKRRKKKKNEMRMEMERVMLMMTAMMSVRKRDAGRKETRLHMKLSVEHV